MILRLTLLERLLHRLHLLPTPVMDTFGGVLFGRILALGVRRGVFEAAGAGPCSAADVAARAGLDDRAARLMCDAFVVAGYLRRTRAGYVATGETRKWLLQDSPRSLCHLVGYFETLYVRWQQIEHSLVHGAPARSYYEGFSSADWETYVLGMRDLARVLAPFVMRHIRLPAGPGRLLDVGGAHGLYSIECCLRRPALSATVMDFPQAVVHAGRGVQDAGLAGRISFLPGDFMNTPFPPGQDVLLMFNIIHGFSPETNRLLIHRAFDALQPGGRIYILDQFQSPSKGSPVSRFIPLMVGLNLLNEIGGNVYSMEEIRAWCGARTLVRNHRVGLPGVGLAEIALQ